MSPLTLGSRVTSVGLVIGRSRVRVSPTALSNMATDIDKIMHLCQWIWPLACRLRTPITVTKQYIIWYYSGRAVMLRSWEGRIDHASQTCRHTQQRAQWTMIPFQVNRLQSHTRCLQVRLMIALVLRKFFWQSISSSQTFFYNYIIRSGLYTFSNENNHSITAMAVLYKIRFYQAIKENNLTIKNVFWC